jgi:hypothetical protein
MTRDGGKTCGPPLASALTQRAMPTKQACAMPAMSAGIAARRGTSIGSATTPTSSACAWEAAYAAFPPLTLTSRWDAPPPVPSRDARTRARAKPKSPLLRAPPAASSLGGKTGVKGTCVALLFPYLHWPTRQGEVFASLFVKPPTTGAASAESYDLYSLLGVLRILRRNYAYRQHVEVT